MQPTYSPLPISYAFRRSMDSAGQESSSPQQASSRAFHVNNMEPAASMQNDIKVHSAYTSFTSDDGRNEDDFAPEENRQSMVFEIMPEMYKFTLEDAIRDTRGSSASGGGGSGVADRLGPVTEAPTEISDHPNGLHSRIVEEYASPNNYYGYADDNKPTIDYPVNAEPSEDDELLNRAPTRYEPVRPLAPRGKFRYNDFEQQRYNNPMVAASRVVQREYRLNSPKPTGISSDVAAITEDNLSTDIITKSPRNFQFMTWEPLQLKLQATKRNAAKTNDKIKNETRMSKRKGRLSDLEVIGSYSRQRTQGTVDAQPNQSHARSFIEQHNEAKHTPDHRSNDASVSSSDQVSRSGTRPSEVNYFQ